MSDEVPVELVVANESRAAGVRWLMMPGAVEQLRLEDLIRRPEWNARAACRGEPRATFFLSLGGSPKRAKALCSICPVQDECLAHALADSELAGIWGGTSARERNALRKNRPAA